MKPASERMRDVNPHIFRSNTIRGIYGEDLDEPILLRIGLAFAAVVRGSAVVVAADHRLSSPSLKDALTEGLLRGGCDVCDAGLAPKGEAIFAAGRLGRPLVYVSASHLPAEWNGVKFVHPNGRTYDKTESEAVRNAFFAAIENSKRTGRAESGSWREEYCAHLVRMPLSAAAPLRVLVDSGNGTAGVVAPELLRRLGYSVTSLFEEPDGRMPNRISELTPESLRAAAAAMSGHDIGVAFDGDADRAAFLDASGAIIDPERFAFVILRELCGKHGGPIIASVTCGGTIADLARRFGREFVRVPTGAPCLVGESMRRQAVFGMESSAHMTIPSVTNCDDAIAVAAYAIWALSKARTEGLTLADLLAEAPVRPRKRVVVKVADADKAEVMETVRCRIEREGLPADDTDGLSVTTDEGWALIRASGTEPAMRLYVEAGNPASLERLTDRFKRWLDDAIAARAINAQRDP